MCDDDRVDAAALYALFASVLVNVPDDGVRMRMERLIEAAGCDLPADAGEECDLEQRFYNRFAIAVSPLYLPAIESCMLDVREGAGGLLEPGHAEGPRTTEVLACYRVYGFDHRALRGFKPLVDTMRPDQLPAELAFMAHLRHLEDMDDAKGRAAGRFAAEFLERHLLAWVPSLCASARQRGPADMYVRLIESLHGWLEIDACRAG